MSAATTRSFHQRIKSLFIKTDRKKVDSKKVAEEIIRDTEMRIPIQLIKNRLALDKSDWHNCSAVAYNLYLKREKKRRKNAENNRYIILTGHKEMDEMLAMNNKLAEFALSLSIFSTGGDVDDIKAHINSLPASEARIIDLIGLITMNTTNRIMQKIGRIEKFPHFKLFTKMIDAASLSFYRNNYISCYLTLLPIIEGILIRWMGYTAEKEKPEFEDIRKFFKNSHTRQPCPENIVFHEVYTKACDLILNRHFYKPTTTGKAYANFNRHVASHVLNDSQFATKENCIRLFNLIDIMTEIYVYESRTNDPRFNLTDEEIGAQADLYNLAMQGDQTPEQIFLSGTPSAV